MTEEKIARIFAYWKARGYTFTRDGVYKGGRYKFSIADAVKQYDMERTKKTEVPF